MISPWHVQKIPFGPIRLARPWNLHGSKHVCLVWNGTNDHEKTRSVPLVHMLFGGSCICVAAFCEHRTCTKLSEVEESPRVLVVLENGR